MCVCVCVCVCVHIYKHASLVPFSKSICFSFVSMCHKLVILTVFQTFSLLFVLEGLPLQKYYNSLKAEVMISIF